MDPISVEIFLRAGQRADEHHGKCPRNTLDGCSRSDYTFHVGELLDPEQLDDCDPFEIDTQAAHLFKHPRLGVDDVFDVWISDPLFYPATPPAHWLMCAEVSGVVLVVPIAPSRTGNPSKCRPIGCYVASKNLGDEYRRDR